MVFHLIGCYILCGGMNCEYQLQFYEQCISIAQVSVIFLRFSFRSIFTNHKTNCFNGNSQTLVLHVMMIYVHFFLSFHTNNNTFFSHSSFQYPGSIHQMHFHTANIVQKRKFAII